MKVYHLTGAQNADAIKAGGFKDSVGRFLTTSEHTGVWVSDVPLVMLSGVDDIACFELEIPEELFRRYEWLEEEKPYRESLIPASELNGWPRRLLTDDELYELPWG
jgi:hypothetical protein